MATKKPINRLTDQPINPSSASWPIRASKTTKRKVTAKKDSSLTVPVFDTKGKESGSVTLPKEVFDVVVPSSLIAQVVRVYQTNQRQSGAHTKTRGQVVGSGRKIYRQKGTGRARHGDRYAPIFVGGGVAHGPHPKDWTQKITINMRRKALCGVLTEKRKTDNLIIINGLEKAEAKTAKLMATMKSMQLDKRGKLGQSVLIATNGKAENIYLAGRNVENLTVKEAQLLNVYEVLRHKKLIVTKEALTLFSKGVS